MIEQLKKCSSEVKMEESKQDKKLDVIRAELPDDDTLYDLADLFKMFGDSTRAKILSCLRRYSAACKGRIFAWERSRKCSE